jgi:cytochrome P450
MVEYQSLYFLALAGAAVYLASKAISYRKRANFCAKHGCKHAPPIPQKWWLFGIDNIQNMVTWARERVFLEAMINMFKDNGSLTVSSHVAGTSYLWTMSPENAKAIMASQAEDFHLSKLRMDGFEPYTGDGVSSSNGATWAHGRAILRPSFSKAQVSNSDVYERHFQELVANIPTDGSLVDLNVLFGRLTLDVATEVIFGESIYSQQRDAL